MKVFYDVPEDVAIDVTDRRIMVSGEEFLAKTPGGRLVVASGLIPSLKLYRVADPARARRKVRQGATTEEMTLGFDGQRWTLLDPKAVPAKVREWAAEKLDLPLEDYVQEIDGREVLALPFDGNVPTALRGLPRVGKRSEADTAKLTEALGPKAVAPQ